MRCEHCGSEVETREVTIQNPVGNPVGLPLTMQIAGPFGVHQGWKWPGWTVTHLATTLAVETGLRSKIVALDFAATLAEHPEDWNFTADQGVKKICRRRRDEARAKVLG